jgi:hypothetical protein
MSKQFTSPDDIDKEIGEVKKRLKQEEEKVKEKRKRKTRKVYYLS